MCDVVVAGVGWLYFSGGQVCKCVRGTVYASGLAFLGRLGWRAGVAEWGQGGRRVHACSSSQPAESSGPHIRTLGEIGARFCRPPMLMTRHVPAADSLAALLVCVCEQ